MGLTDPAIRMRHKAPLFLYYCLFLLLRSSLLFKKGTRCPPVNGKVQAVRNHSTDHRSDKQPPNPLLSEGTARTQASGSPGQQKMF